MHREDMMNVEMLLLWPGGIRTRCLVQAVHLQKEEPDRDPFRVGRPLGSTSEQQRIHITVDNPQVIETTSVYSLVQNLGPEAGASFVLSRVREHLPEIYWTRYYRHANECPKCVGWGSGLPEDARAYQHAPSCTGAALAANLDTLQGRNS